MLFTRHAKPSEHTCDTCRQQVVVCNMCDHCLRYVCVECKRCVHVCYSCSWKAGQIGLIATNKPCRDCTAKLPPRADVPGWLVDSDSDE
jgi:hypothetical protein